VKEATPMNRMIVFLAAALSAAAGHALAAMTLTSADIRPDGPIALQQVFTRCGGRNVSPEVVWSGAPPGTKSLVLTMIDLDVKPHQWSHWIVVDLSPTAAAIPHGATTLPGKARAIANNHGVIGYTGPCPPKGSGIHHYRFTIWAMPTPAMTITPDAKADSLAPSLARQAIGSASFVGWVKG
jgi:Raf kinase inhibitor-like YbhB/YbcL family protein